MTQFVRAGNSVGQTDVTHRVPRRRRHRSVVARLGVAAFVVALFPVVPSAVASAASITNAGGPLTRVEISPELNCAVDYLGDTSPEFFGDTACATLVATGGTLYGPSDIPAGGSASPRTAYTPVSQTQGGTGTTADPYVVNTAADAGTSGLQVRQVDRYVAGQETYRTDITVANTTNASATAVVYKAADCYLQNSDFGYGVFDASSGAISCVTSLDPGARIEQFYPITPGSHYAESDYSDVWALVGSQQPLPDECRQCANSVDNGMGLSWNVTVPAGGSVTVSHLTNFSPLGNVPLEMTKTARDPQTPSGGTNAYTITVNNPNTAAVALTSVTDQLPASFSYVPGSTTGATTTDPAISGSTLTWSGPFNVPAGSNITLSFGVNVGTTTGVFSNQASAVADGVYTVAPTGPTAPVEVGGGPVNHPPVADAQSVSTPQDTAKAITLTGSDADSGDVLTYTVATQPSHGSLSGAAPALTYTPAPGYTGPDSFTFTVNDGHVDSAAATVSITVTPPALTQLEIDADARICVPRKTDVEFDDVEQKSSGPLTGTVQFEARHAEFKSRSFSVLAFAGNTLGLVVGTGKYNHHSGYSFAAVVVDSGRHATAPDLVFFFVNDSSGQTAMSSEGWQPLCKGDVRIHEDHDFFSH